MGEPLFKRRELLDEHVFPMLSEPIHCSPVLETRVKDLIHAVKAQRMEGLIATRRSSKYEPGLRSGAWQKMRVNKGQEFVTAGTLRRRRISMRWWSGITTVVRWSRPESRAA
jgi:bifunctional non-homologous end joining protein LigD